MRTDKYGRTWDFPKNELCPTCGQPDSCGDCNHKKLSEKEVKILKGEEIVQTTLFGIFDPEEGGFLTYEHTTNGWLVFPASRSQNYPPFISNDKKTMERFLKVAKGEQENYGDSWDFPKTSISVKNSSSRLLIKEMGII